MNVQRQESHYPAEVLDALMLNLKETAPTCNLDCFLNVSYSDLLHLIRSSFLYINVMCELKGRLVGVMFGWARAEEGGIGQIILDMCGLGEMRSAYKNAVDDGIALKVILRCNLKVGLNI